MPGWIPRRLGGGLGGKKESGQLRFGGRERPFRAPLSPIPLDDLKRLGIPPPPEGNYMSLFEISSPPRRNKHADREDRSTLHNTRSSSRDRLHEERESLDTKDGSRKSHKHSRSYHDERERPYSHDRHYDEREDNSKRSRDSHRHKRTSRSRDQRSEARQSSDREQQSEARQSSDRERSHKRHRHE